jgi:putative peptidoglycan lipid II flippase
LAGFAIGLVGFSLYLFTLRGFYAHMDTRTPFVINIGQCLLNIVFGVVFVSWWGILGLAAAFALSYLLAALWSLQVLAYKVRGFPVRAVLGAILAMAVAGALAGEVAWVVARHVGSNAGVEAVARLLAASLAGLVTYVALLAVLHSPEIRSVRSLVRRRA